MDAQEKTYMNNSLLYPSLELIKHDTKIKGFYFIPGVFSVAFLSLILVYQTLYTYIVLLGNSESFSEKILGFFDSDYGTPTLITLWCIALFYITLMPLFEWALIRYIEAKNEDTQASRSDALGFGIVRFAPLFEYNNIFNMFKFISIVNGYLFALRFLGLDYVFALSIVFGVAFIFSVILNILTSYARYEIVLEKKWVFEAIGVSSQIALLNMKTTIRLYFMMFIMNFKVLINFMIFLIFPLLTVSILWFISSQIFSLITFIILAGVFVLLLCLMGYMAGVLEIFTTAIWYHAYKQGKEKLLHNKM